MPCPHNEISIVQRSQQQSAIAAAAYQSGEKLFCEYDQQVKHYPEKRGIVHNEILLPANAPQKYADRNTLSTPGAWSAPSSSMDLQMNINDEDSPLSMKADFLLSLCELIVGGKEGLQPIEKTVIDRCVRLV